MAIVNGNDDCPDSVEKNLDLLTEQAKCFFWHFLVEIIFLVRFLVLKVGQLFNVVLGREKLG